MTFVATDLDRADLRTPLAARGLSIVMLDDQMATGAELLLLGWNHRERGAASRLYEVRDHGWPGPVMLVVDGDSEAVARAIDAGADDAVDATCSPDEIAARLAAIMRSPPEPIIGLGKLRIDRLHRHVTRDGKKIDLLPREYALLLHLALNAGQCISRSALLRCVWGLRFDPGTNVVEVHVSRLRAKLDRGFARPMLLTEKGRGYRLAGGPVA